MSEPEAIAVYMRVSGMIQRNRGTIETQRPDIDRYLDAYGYMPYGWYEDEAVSGKWIPFTERPQGRRLLADARAGHVNLVIVWRLDRFGRNTVEILKAVQELEQAGARLYSLKEQFDTRTAAGRLMLTMLAGMAEYEWESIMERSSAGIERRLASGKPMGGNAPYGYIMQKSRQDTNLAPDEMILGLPSFPDLTPAGVVRLIYHLLLEEHLSTIAIANRLNDMEVPTSYQQRGTPYYRAGQVEPTRHIWRANVIRSIIKNPVNKGEYRFGRRSAHHKGREIVTCAVPALVSVETWEAAQAQLEKNLKWSPRNAKHDYLLRGLMRCGLCGHIYVGDAYRDTVRYVCYAQRKPQNLFGSRALTEEHRCRDSLPLNAAAVEADIWAFIDEIIRNPGPTLAALQAKLSGQADTSEAIRADLAKLQQEQAAMQEERDVILRYFRKGQMTERDLNRQMADIASEEAKRATEIASLIEDLEASDKVSARVEGARNTMREVKDTLDDGLVTPEKKRAAIEALIDVIVIRHERDETAGKMRPRCDIAFVPGIASQVGIADYTLYLADNKAKRCA